MADKRTISRVKRLAFDAPKTGDEAKAATLRRRYRRWSLDNPNFVGVGVGEKISSGQLTGENALRIFVAQKLPKDMILPEEQIPREITFEGERIAVDVEEIGVPQAELSDEVGPGDRIGRAGAYGTLGCYVQLKEAAGPKPPHTLSCAHVLATGGVVGNAIFRTAPAGRRKIGALAGFATLRYSDPDHHHTVDAAIAQLDRSETASIRVPTIGRIRGVQFETPSKVMKFGAVTGYTSGSVDLASHSGWFRYDAPNGGKIDLWFDDVVKCSKYSAEGDSGSAVLDEDTGALVGLHFAGSDSASFYIKIRKVFAELNIELWLP